MMEPGTKHPQKHNSNKRSTMRESRQMNGSQGGNAEHLWLALCCSWWCVLEW